MAALPQASIVPLPGGDTGPFQLLTCSIVAARGAQGHCRWETAPPVTAIGLTTRNGVTGGVEEVEEVWRWRRRWRRWGGGGEEVEEAWSRPGGLD
ncbi:hypothetical protein EYF80_057730 [Liparis tanakae]|uniref:Uncharacterized protein n=1 Tax=Liparis tanakae TaxID=230148 RepID=A0A4Z2EU57_9TELE|nr:hypothetical protein EYF80_057730 [Liparis tanakae]